MLRKLFSIAVLASLVVMAPAAMADRKNSDVQQGRDHAKEVNRMQQRDQEHARERSRQAREDRRKVKEAADEVKTEKAEKVEKASEEQEEGFGNDLDDDGVDDSE